MHSCGFFRYTLSDYRIKMIAASLC